MNPGKLNRKIVIQARTVTKDATGSRVETWADSANAWAEIVKQTGKETVPADADRNSDSRQFRIHYRSFLIGADATTKYRILYQYRFYDISGIEEEGVKNKMLISATATQAIS